MQFPDRLTVLFLLILNFAISQSIESAYGLGLNKSSLHTSTIGSGGAGLIPTFHQGASIDNISSWPNQVQHLFPFPMKLNHLVMNKVLRVLYTQESQACSSLLLLKIDLLLVYH